MIKYTVNYNTGTEIIQVPTSWNDVKLKTYIDLVNRDNGNWITRISILIGITEENINTLPVSQIESWILDISFLADFSEIENCTKIPVEYKDFKIGSLEFGWYEEAMAVVTSVQKQELNLINAGVKVAECFTRFRIDGKEQKSKTDFENSPVLEVLSTINFFLIASVNSLNGINTSMKMTKKMQTN